MDAKLPDIAIAEQLAERIVAFDAAELPEASRAKCEETLIDVTGLCIAARNEDYVRAALMRAPRMMLPPPITTASCEPARAAWARSRASAARVWA